MAHVLNIWFFDAQMKPENNFMAVNVALKPSGQVRIDVPIPPDFHDTLCKMAQAAADKHEQDMRAQILADNAKEGK